jgi:hypothetical protein
VLRTSNNSVIIVDDFIPLSLQEKYKTMLLKENFPWYFISDITTSENLQTRPALSHLLYDNGVKISPLEIEFFGHLGAAKFGWAFNSIMHGKALLQLPLNTTLLGDKLDNLHVDVDPYVPHLVVLYYVVDADGDTIITDSRANSNKSNTIPFENHKVIHRVTPKQGRAVLFDGSYYHTAEQPKNGIRCIINLNIF